MPRVVRSSGGGSGGPSASIAAASSSSSKSAAVDDRHAALRFWAPPPRRDFQIRGGCRGGERRAGVVRARLERRRARVHRERVRERQALRGLDRREGAAEPRATSSPGKDASPCGVGAVAGARRASPWAAVRGAPGVAPGTGASKGPRARAPGTGTRPSTGACRASARSATRGRGRSRRPSAGRRRPTPRAIEIARGERGSCRGAFARSCIAIERAPPRARKRRRERARRGSTRATRRAPARGRLALVRPTAASWLDRFVRNRGGRARAIAARGERSPTERFGTNVKIASVIAGHHTRGELRSCNVRAPRQI